MAPRPNLVRNHDDCGVGYQWYTCSRGALSYAGCCDVDPCSLPNFCPTYGVEVSVAGTSTRGIGTLSLATPSAVGPTPSSSDASGRTTVYVTADPTRATGNVPYTATMTVHATTTASRNARDTTKIGLGATVGIAVGAILVAIISGLWIWGTVRRRRRAEKRLAENESPRKSSDSGKALTLGTKDVTSSENLTRRPSAAQVVDEFGGRHHDPGSPGSEDDKARNALRVSHITADGSTLASPLTPSSIIDVAPQGCQELDSKPLPELDSVPVVSPRARASVAEPASPTEDEFSTATARRSAQQPPPQALGCGRGETDADARPVACGHVDRPRATLRATMYERWSNTYANSWSKFQNVQI